MAEPAPHVVEAPLEFLIGKLAAMGKETGYRRNYRGVRRFRYALPIEEDESVPWLQVEVGDGGEFRPEHSSALSLTMEVFVQVHLFADTMPNGDRDINGPLLDAKADIHFCTYQDRFLGQTNLWIQKDEEKVTQFGVDEVIGATLTMTYIMNYIVLAEDLSVPAPGM